MQRGTIRNNMVTASSAFNKYHAAWLGRLGRPKRGAYVGAWCARHNNHNQWFKVDFGRPTKITKIATQGRQDTNQWVTAYYVSSSMDGIHWSMFRFRSGDKVCLYSVVLCESLYNKAVYLSLLTHLFSPFLSNSNSQLTETKTAL